MPGKMHKAADVFIIFNALVLFKCLWRITNEKRHELHIPPHSGINKRAACMGLCLC